MLAKIKSAWAFFFPKPERDPNKIKNIHCIKIVKGRGITKDVGKFKNSIEFKELSNKMEKILRK